jgi:hypothetical protein
MARVAHDGIETTAVVPRTALPRMTEQGWYEVDDNGDRTDDTVNGAPQKTSAKKTAAKPGQPADNNQES